MAGKKEKKKKEDGSKISDTEWGMVISFLFIVDGIQLGLNFIGIPFIATLGLLVNRFISFAMALAWPTYLYLRGVNLGGAKMISVVVTFFVESIPNIDSLPMWGLEGIYMMALVKAEEKIKYETGVDVGTIVHMSKKGPSAETSNALNAGTASENRGVEIGQEKPENEEGDREKEKDENVDNRGEENEDEENGKEKPGGQKSYENKPSQNPRPKRNTGSNQLNLRNQDDNSRTRGDEDEKEKSLDFHSNIIDLTKSFVERQEEKDRDAA